MENRDWRWAPGMRLWSYHRDRTPGARLDDLHLQSSLQAKRDYPCHCDTGSRNEDGLGPCCGLFRGLIPACWDPNLVR